MWYVFVRFFECDHSIFEFDEESKARDFATIWHLKGADVRIGNGIT